MEFIDGAKPSDAAALAQAGLDGRVVAERGAKFVLRQIFDFGLFHTDPHPGNLLIMPGNVIAALDFGQVARLMEQDRRLVAELAVAIVDVDAGRLVAAFRRADLLADTTDPRQLARDLDEVLELYHDLPLAEIPFGQMVARTFSIMRRHDIRPPAQFTLMLKALMTIESVGVSLDPRFAMADHLKPYVQRLRLEGLDPRRILRAVTRAGRDLADLAERAPEDIKAILAKARKGQFQFHIQHEHLEEFTRTVDRSSDRISFALIITGCLVASSLLVTQKGEIFGLVAYQTMGTVGYLVAAILGGWLIVLILRGRKV
jgi:ubiquinone biosynthesis protein